MRDPLEGVSASGTITTGADRTRVPLAFAPILDAAIEAIRTTGQRAAIYVYGSVATGQARPGTSDVDLLTVDLSTSAASRIAGELSAEFSAVCRGVEIAAANSGDFIRDGDEAYGARVFLRHYCVHLVGPDHDHSDEDFPADRRAARGFNGDIVEHARRWRQAISDSDEDPATIARQVARKTLLAVAGLVSIHDHTWTTDREHAARRWAEIDTAHAEGLTQMLHWIDGSISPRRELVVEALDDTVERIASQFANLIGLWPDRTA
jgi:uncharacterized protein